jgi:pyruvate/2-oxoglutarate/acetoin dehydrogenase E1 component
MMLRGSRSRRRSPTRPGPRTGGPCTRTSPASSPRQATRHASAAAVIAAEVADRGFEYLKAPVKLVTALDATVPYSKPMEEYLLPDEAKIAAAVRAVVP